MTEWDAANYVRRSSLQEATAEEALALFQLNGNEHIPDIGYGDGRVTARIALRPWLPDPNPSLRCIRATLKPKGRAQLRLVADGERKSLETVLHETP